MGGSCSPSFVRLLDENGPIARRIRGFTPRLEQQAMAEEVARAIEERAVLITEAGTGIGKTFAYLVPALRSSGKVIVSTGTKTLQDQLFHRDLPLVREALGRDTRLALLKGRSNYLCRYRFARAEAAGTLESGASMAALHRLREWSGRTLTGDLSEAADVPEDPSVWFQVSSTSENCLGKDCPQYRDCYLAVARRKAQEADLVVINHHLFFADLALKDEGFGDLLPGADTFILDEAHQLPDVATDFYGASLSSRQLTGLLRDALLEHSAAAEDGGQLEGRARCLEQALGELRRVLGEGPRRVSWEEASQQVGLRAAAARLQVAVDSLEEALEPLAAHTRGLENCWERCCQYRARWASLMQLEARESVRWLQILPKSFTMHLTPLDVSGGIRSQTERLDAAWVFTSATLSVGESFAHFARRMGLDGARERRWSSPFRYADQALLYLPRDVPDPRSEGYGRAVLEASRGRAFFLFTSHRALREAAHELPTRLPYPLLVQGDSPRGVLLERFRRLGDAVLLGSASFWEGVDVRGPALSCVIIDRLPFASPGDPILSARIEALRRQGRDPFSEYQLPQAVLALKQGVGRLIRDASDRGVMVLCDPRLLRRAYGRVFLDSLPPMPRTRCLSDVVEFFAGH
jgi:ATP-dependent DNA helicase DinG